jgi:hypothetical protein
MVGQVLVGNGMPFHGPEPATHLAAASHNREVVKDTSFPIIEPYVVVGTETEHIVGCIRSVVRATERANMGPLGVGARWGHDTLAAHLAGVVVEPLDLLDDGCAAHQPLHLCRHARGGSTWRTLGHRFWYIQRSTHRWLADETVAPDAKVGTSLLLPVRLDKVQAVIAIPSCGR